MSLYGIKDAANLTIKSNTTNKVVLYTDYCNSTNIEFTSDPVYAMKKGVKAIGWDTNRDGSMTTEMQVFDLAWVAMLMGSEMTTGVAEISKREVLTVTSASATLAAAPKAGSLSIFKLDTDGITQLTEQTVGTPASQPNTYSISTATLTFNSTTWASDGKVVAYYLLDSAATARTFTVKSNTFPSGYSVVGNTTIRSDSNVDKVIEFRMGNVKPRSNMSLTFSSDDVTTLSIEWDIFADSDNDMFTFIEI
jgi:hypothetical protein